MSYKNFIFGLVIVLCVSACGSDNSETVSNSTVAPAQEQNTTSYDSCIEVEGLQRCWNLQTPEVASDVDQPLVIDLHGFTSSPVRQKEISGFAELGETEGFIVAWPKGISTSWNAGQACCGVAVKSDIDDVAFLSEMIDKLVKDQTVDSKRIYLTGLSNGCAMSQRLASELSNKVTAVACMAHFLLTDISPDYKAIPIMQLHGTSDDIVPYSEADDNFQNWVSINGCEGFAVTKEGSSNKITSKYTQCDNDSEVVFITIKEGGHGLYKDLATDVDTTLTAWNFLKEHTKK